MIDIPPNEAVADPYQRFYHNIPLTELFFKKLRETWDSKGAKTVLDNFRNIAVQYYTDHFPQLYKTLPEVYRGAWGLEEMALMHDLAHSANVAISSGLDQIVFDKAAGIQIMWFLTSPNAEQFIESINLEQDTPGTASASDVLSIQIIAGDALRIPAARLAPSIIEKLQSKFPDLFKSTAKLVQSQQKVTDMDERIQSLASVLDLLASIENPNKDSINQITEAVINRPDTISDYEYVCEHAKLIFELSSIYNKRKTSSDIARQRLIDIDAHIL